MCIGKTVFRTVLIGGLALGGATLLLGPERMASGFTSVRGKVQSAVDGAINSDDPVVIRRQLQKLASELPKKIAELQGELALVDAQISRMTKDSEVVAGMVELTSSDIGELQTWLARAESAANSTGKPVAFHFDGRRFNLESARRELHRIHEIRTASEDRLAMNHNDLKYLTEQRDRLASFVAQLESEQATIDSQMYQIDRKIEAIARNERLVETLEQREQALANYSSALDLSSLEAIDAKLKKWQIEVDTRLQRFERKTQHRDYENEVRFRLQQREREGRDSREFEIEETTLGGSERSVVLGPREIE